MAGEMAAWRTIGISVWRKSVAENIARGGNGENQHQRMRWHAGENGAAAKISA